MLLIFLFLDLLLPNLFNFCNRLFVRWLNIINNFDALSLFVVYIFDRLYDNLLFCYCLLILLDRSRFSGLLLLFLLFCVGLDYEILCWLCLLCGLLCFLLLYFSILFVLLFSLLLLFPWILSLLIIWLINIPCFLISILLFSLL